MILMKGKEPNQSERLASANCKCCLTEKLLSTMTAHKNASKIIPSSNKFASFPLVPGTTQAFKTLLLEICPLKHLEYKMCVLNL